MSAYTKHDAIIHIDGTRYALTRPLIWRVRDISGPRYTVPAGFGFDAPLSDDISYLKAMALRAHMLSTNSRRSADAQFYAALTADGVPKWRRFVIFIATALWRHWSDQPPREHSNGNEQSGLL